MNSNELQDVLMYTTLGVVILTGVIRIVSEFTAHARIDAMNDKFKAWSEAHRAWKADVMAELEKINSGIDELQFMSVAVQGLGEEYDENANAGEHFENFEVDFRTGGMFIGEPFQGILEHNSSPSVVIE